MTRSSPRTYSYAARIAFVVELAEHLHAYGTTAQRLEGAVVGVAHQLGLECEPRVSPTGMLLAFSDPQRPPGESDITRVLRMGLGEVDLYKLSEADRIAEEVLAGTLDLSDGHAALLELDLRRPGRGGRSLHTFGFAMIAGGVAALWRLPWLGVATAGGSGLLGGLLGMATRNGDRLKEAYEALAGMLAGFVAIAVASTLGPLNLNTVVIASLLVLLPGMAITNAVNELTSQHLVSGTARFSGAVATVIKLTVGTMIALTIAQMLGIEPQVRAWRPERAWVVRVGLQVTGAAFSALFRARVRDVPLGMAAAPSGYLIARNAGLAGGGPFGL